MTWDNDPKSKILSAKKENEGNTISKKCKNITKHMVNTSGALITKSV